MNRETLLAKLKAEVTGCQACNLRKSATQVVFGEGSPEARLVFVGEGPGAEEDRTGRPFVGAAGQLLDKMIGAMGMTRFADTYILNVVKCRPPGNRAPVPEEAQICQQHLERQFAILDPVIVVLLGATALRTLIDPTGRITQARGHWVHRDDRWFMPTFHPAALLRNPQYKIKAWGDLKLVIDKYRELVEPDHDSLYYPRL